ncbi:MAG: hypothetical protein DRG55_01005 [Deltaproteobacteria bacterium]|nr:MAG: hypothetical protein DRG55_01005 [Deltaproteobacteria bacterium]
MASNPLSLLRDCGGFQKPLQGPQADGKGTRDAVHSIERTNFFLFLLFLGGSLLFWDLGVFLGVLLGGAIMAANFRAMRRIFEGAMVEGVLKRVIVLRYGLKFLALLGAVLGVFIFLRGWVNPLAFLVGLFTLFPATLIEGFRGYLRQGG